MDKKIKIGIMAVLGITISIFNPLLMGVLAIAFWIYLGVFYKKSKDEFFKIIGANSKWMKAFLTIALISFLISIAAMLMHNIQSGTSESEESRFFTIGLMALYAFILASAGGLILFLKGRQQLV